MGLGIDPAEQMSSSRSFTRSQARSLLSIARLKIARSRIDSAISRRTRIDHTCLGSRGFFWPTSNPLFQGRWHRSTGRAGIRDPPPTPPSASLYSERMTLVPTDHSGFPHERAHYDRFWRIVLKNSKIAGLRKSRKCNALAISAAARRCRIETRASHRFCGNSCGPSTRSKGNAPAVLRIFGHQRKRTFSTQSANSRHHSISSVACMRSALGMVMPRALAVLRFITRKNLVGCKTGRSAGLAPLRILPT